MPRPIFDSIFVSDHTDAAWNFRADTALVHLTFDAGIAIAMDADGNERFKSEDPFEALRWMERYDLSAMPDARWVGYISYEFARFIERLPATTQDDLRVPLFWFTLCRPGREPVADNEQSAPKASERFRKRSFERIEFESAVQRAIDYIAAGDIFQVNLAQRLTFTCKEPTRIWNRLRPSRYGVKLSCGSLSLLSNSPELFFRLDAKTRTITSRPIKGTKPRTPGMDQALLASTKDQAELAMIVDLQRNDLGRVCEIGSVAVTDPRSIEAHAGVYHTVATIEGTLRSDAGFSDVIRALFPCGSITGCPKIRAMEIIDELEPVVRGPYCGAIGYLAADGSAEFNVAIRTMVVKDGLAHVSVGGGIVADSTPAGEYDETIVKAQAMLAALGLDAAALKRLAEDAT